METTPPSDFARFVPGLLHGVNGPGFRVDLVGHCLSIDVAGFTTLSERLQVHGSQGTEEMTVLLGRFFAPAIDLILIAGGDVLGFAGDSMLAAFAGSDPDTEQLVLATAEGVLETARGMAGVESLVGLIDLGVRIGVAPGDVALAVAGDQHELRVVATGDGIDGAVAAQLDARIGSVGRGHRSGVAPGGTTRSNIEARPSASDSTFARFVPIPVADRIRAGAPGLVDEHRLVTTVFVGLRSGSRLDDVLKSVPILLETADHFGGALLNVDCTDKGASILLTFGTPVTHAEDAARAIACAQDLEQRFASELRIGVATGASFSGIVGSAMRASYTVFGDSVNLAARLMQLAEPGQILVDEATRAGAGAAFRWGPTRIRRLKGKELSVSAATLAAVIPELRVRATLEERLVGRDRELATLLRALSSAEESAGRTVVVTGGAGVGKSRLALALADEAVSRGVQVAMDGFELTTSRSPYAGMRHMWKHLLGLSDAASVEDLEVRLSELGAEMFDLAPVLGGALGLASEVAPSSTAERDVRGDAMRALLFSLLAQAASLRPWLLILDDFQWADAASQEVVKFLAERLSGVPVLLLVLTRGDHPLRHVVTEELEHMELRDLDPSDAEVLAHNLVGSDGSEAREMAERSGGNPLFLGELVRHSRDGNRETLPASLPGLLLATIDQLSSSEQATIKAASVLGRSFRAHDLVGSFGSHDLMAVEDALDRLTDRGLLPRTTMATEPAHVFRSDTLQETVYDSLSHATRRRLHEAAGSWFEIEYETDLEPHLDLVAHHYGRSSNVAKQRTYFALAGERSTRLFANENAIEYFERLSRLDEHPEVRTLRELGKLYAHVGRRTEAEERLREAVRCGAPNSDPFSLASLGRLLAEQLRLDEARALLSEAVQRAEDLGDGPALLAALSGLAVALGQGGDHPAAEACAREHLALARDLADPVAEATALLDIGVNVNDQGRLVESLGELHRAHRIVEDHPGALRWRIESTLFLVCERQGNLRQAVSWLLAAEETARTIGYEPGLAINLGDEGNVRFLVGDFPGAETCFREALNVTLRVGEGRGIVHGLLILAGIGEEGIEPMAFYDRAEAVARRSGDERDLARILLDRAWADAGRGSLETAAEALDAAKTHVGTTTGDLHDQAQIESASLEARRGAIAREEAAALLRELAADALLEHDRVDALHQLARLIPEDEALRKEAAVAIRSLYQRSPYLQYRLAYQEVTGELLPAVDLLGPTDTDASVPTVSELIRRVDALLATPTEDKKRG